MTTQGCRILVVDDDVDLAEAMTEVLVAQSHRTDIAFDGRSAIEKCATRSTTS